MGWSLHCVLLEFHLICSTGSKIFLRQAYVKIRNLHPQSSTPIHSLLSKKVLKNVYSCYETLKMQTHCRMDFGHNEIIK